MIKIDRILCPTDLSTASDDALRYVVALARAYDAKLFLLHCSASNPLTEEETGRKNQMMRMFTESLAPHLGLAELRELNWEGVIVKGASDIGAAIVRAAAEHKIDLIVMRSRRRPRAAVLLGSTAETVCGSAPCPVLVTHPQEREWVGLTTGEIDLHRILVAHDFSRDSEVALKYGLSLAQEYQAEVHLLHVLAEEGQQEPELAWSSSSGGNAYTFAARRLQQVVPKEAHLWSDCINAVSYGKASEEIVAYAKRHAIDLICIGGSGSDWSLGKKVFGSNVDRVLRQAPCPVLIARPTEPAHGDGYAVIEEIGQLALTEGL